MEYPLQTPKITKLFPVQKNGCGGDSYIKQIKSDSGRQQSFSCGA